MEVCERERNREWKGWQVDGSLKFVNVFIWSHMDE